MLDVGASRRRRHCWPRPRGLGRWRRRGRHRAVRAGGSAGRGPVRARRPRRRAVLGLARGQQYNLDPGSLPVRLHAVYELIDDPTLRVATGRRTGTVLGLRERAAPCPTRSRSRPCTWPTSRTTRCCWRMRSTPRWRSTGVPTTWPSGGSGRCSWPTLRRTSPTSTPGCRRSCGRLTVAWEVLDLPRMHRSLRAIELLARSRRGRPVLRGDAAASAGAAPGEPRGCAHAGAPGGRSG